MRWPTHEVSNQPPPLAGVNLFDADAALVAGVLREGANTGLSELRTLGSWAGSDEARALADRANRHPPELHTHDPQGQRIDRVEFDPAWHALLAKLRASGVQGRAWQTAQRGAHVARTAAFYLHGQTEAGSLCPVTMTFAAIPVLKNEPWFATLADKLYSETHDCRDLPIAEKSSILIGMGLTEKQGGSDLRSTQTDATPVTTGGRGADYRLNGHKWFFSAPMCDAHLVLARTAEGPSAFFVPRWQPDGSKNAVLIQRLKDKLGNRSNASSEVEFFDAQGTMIGEPGRGIATLVEMANITRLDCAIASAALMRQALCQSFHYCMHRVAFGKPLAQQPLMMNVLADLALESEAALLLVLRLARAFDEGDKPLLRLLTPAAKFWICKRAIEFCGECMEILGGSGYVEEGPLAWLYREAPVNSIWEGSGNVMCLDVLRAAHQAGDTLAPLLSSLSDAAAKDPRLNGLLNALNSGLAAPPDQQQRQARSITQALVLLVQAELMMEHAPSPVADTFIASRCDAGHGRVYGTLNGTLTGAMNGTLPALDAEAIIRRAWPVQTR